jgi:hypothetical protein
MNCLGHPSYFGTTHKLASSWSGGEFQCHNHTVVVEGCMEDYKHDRRNEAGNLIRATAAKELASLALSVCARFKAFWLFHWSPINTLQLRWNVWKRFSRAASPRPLYCLQCRGLHNINSRGPRESTSLEINESSLRRGGTETVDDIGGPMVEIISAQSISSSAP